MINASLLGSKNKYFIILSCFILNFAIGQEITNDAPKQKSKFWENVSIGGGLGLSFGNGFSSYGLSPSAIYKFNDFFAAGIGLTGSYTARRDDFSATIFGGSIVGLAKPIEQIIVSVEFEENNVQFKDKILNTSENYWQPALFLGAGYNINNFSAIGVRYDVLFDNDRSLYSSALLPFIRVYF